jgi:hypothetical protein
VDRLARSVAEIEMALRNAEAEIVADAQERIRGLRQEAMADLTVRRAGTPARRRR